MTNLVAKPNLFFKSPSGDRIDASSSTKDFTIKAKKEADISVVTATGNTTHIWKFNTAGDLVLPAGGDITDDDGNSVFGNEFTIPALQDYAKYTDLADVATSGSYNDLTDKPTLFNGSYSALTGKPTLFSGSYNDLTDKPTGGSTFSGSYADLSNKPTIPTLTSQLTNDSGFLTSAPTNITGNAGTVTNGVYTNVTQTISGIKSFTAQLNVNTAAGIATNQTTFPLVNTTATTVNFAGAATTINIGADTGITTIYNNLHVAGDITFTGDSTTLSATNLDVTDSLIYLAIDNEADILDIGWVGAYKQSSIHKHTGLVRDAGDGKWKLFSGITAEPTTTVDFTGATYDTLKANIEGNVTGNVTGDVSGSSGSTTGNAATVTNGFYTTSSFYLGTTAIAVNRSSASQTLNGVSVDGNAGTVTNGVYTSGSYANPTWITSLASSKLTGSIGVAAGGTGASTLTGYVKGSGTSALTASSTIPNTDISGLGTMSTQGADSVTITGGSITGLSEVGVSGGTITVTNNTSSSAVKITQTGIGNALLVEDSASTDSSPFVIDKDGNVGIGTVTASYKLTTVGAGDLAGFRTADTNFSQLLLGSSASNYTYIKSNNGGTGTTLPLAIFTGSTEALRIDTSQQLMVGLTAVPGSAGNSKMFVSTGITVANNGATLPYFQTYNSNATTDLKTWRFGGNDSGTFVISTVNDAYSSSTDRLRIDSAGNAGVGVTPKTWSLGKALEVGASGSALWGRAAETFITNNTTYNGGWTYANNGAANYLATGSDGEIYFGCAPTGTAAAGATFTNVFSVNKDKTLALQGASSYAGTGISFPASQNGSTNPNTLDDYEEGTWTPSVGGSATYVAQVGAYTKIGRLVVATFEVNISSIGTGGTTSISGLPFTSFSSPTNGMGGSVGYFTSAASTVTSITLRMDLGATSVAIASIASAASGMNAGLAFFGNNTRILGSITYMTA